MNFPRTLNFSSHVLSRGRKLVPPRWCSRRDQSFSLRYLGYRLRHRLQYISRQVYKLRTATSCKNYFKITATSPVQTSVRSSLGQRLAFPSHKATQDPSNCHFAIFSYAKYARSCLSCSVARFAWSKSNHEDSSAPILEICVTRIQLSWWIDDTQGTYMQEVSFSCGLSWISIRECINSGKRRAMPAESAILTRLIGRHRYLRRRLVDRWYAG